jgi:dTDP-glucose pyrophosphorylase
MKGLILSGKPVLFYAIEALAEAGIRDIGHRRRRDR